MRVFFVVAMFCGAAVLGLAAVYLYFSVWAAWSAGSYFNLRALVLPTLPLFGAGACAAGIFMSPREFRTG